MKKISAIILICITAALTLCGCKEADRVNYNISQQAKYFECERRVTVYNARTDKCVMLIEGFINIETDKNNSELVRCVDDDGTLYNDCCGNYRGGIRPFCILKSCCEVVR